MIRLKTTFFLIAILLLNGLSSFGQQLPTPSPLGKVEQRVGLTDVTITYSRPGVKERTIFGDLVPFDKIWRAGANKATKIEFNTPVKINNVELAAGAYAIFMIPSKDKEWTIIFNKDINQWGTGSYSQDKDAVRVNVKPTSSPMRETMTFVIDHVKNTSAVITWNWEKTSISIPFSVSFEEQAMKNIEEELNKLNGAYGSYNRIARYYVDNGIKLTEALELSKKSVELSEKYWNVYTLSLVQAANNMHKEAIATAEKSKALATTADNQTYVARNEKNIAKWSKKK